MWRNENLKPHKQTNAVFESLEHASKNDKNNILMLPIYQNCYGEHENHKEHKYSTSAYMQFLHGALQL